tara:strand:- start:756 stop:986 length:231 start_codon:yes stop_codon:yes gene_type:complete
LGLWSIWSDRRSIEFINTSNQRWRSPDATHRNDSAVFFDELVGGDIDGEEGVAALLLKRGDDNVVGPTVPVKFGGF